MAHNICGGFQLLDLAGVRFGVVVRLVVAKITPSPAAPLAASALRLDFLFVTHCSTFLKQC